MNWLYFWLRANMADGDVLRRSGRNFVGITPSALVAAATPAAHFTPSATNTYDVGITGTRWRTGYFGTSLVSPSVGPSAAQQHTLPAVASDTVALLAAAQTLGGKTLTTPNIAHVRDAVGGAGWSTESIAGAVNGLVLENSATGVYVSVVPGAPSGADANITVRYRARGTGAGQLGNPANTLVHLEWGATGLGFFGAAQAAQPVAIADIGAFTDPPSAAEMAALRTAVNSTLAALRTLGLIAT